MVKQLRVLPLGGLGEIGKNMTVVEYDGRIVVIDTGLMFPTSEMLGIDLVLPDYTYLRERADDIEAIVLTHGHEDHVGALPFLLRDISVPKIYGRPLTIAMVRSKLDEHKIKDAPLEEFEPGDQIEVGPFEIEPVHMSHSIPDSCMVALRCDAGTVLMTGDYKFDQTPVDGPPADMSRLAELGREGVLLLCGDSTNADRPGFATSESAVGPVLEDVIARSEGRVLITSFASNIHRLQQVIDAAEVLDKKLALVGRSMRKNLNIARNLDHAVVPEGMIIQPSETDNYPDDRIVILCTGSQGEPLSALRRMAHREHRQVELHSGDTVIFSATPIPGNERAVAETVNRLFEIGAEVITTEHEPVHASGHGSAEELKLMLNLTQPDYVMPVHGDMKRLHLHGKLAEAVGIDPEDIFIGANGLPLDFVDGKPQFGERVQSGMIFVDGLGVGDIQDVALRDRRTLSADGVFIVVATISAQDGSSVSPPEIIFRGVAFLQEADEILDELRDEVEESLRRAATDHVHEIGMLQEFLHDDVAEFVYKRLKRRPMILPVVVEV